MSKNKKAQTTQTQAQAEEKKLYTDINLTWKSGRLVRDAEIIANGKFVRFTLANNYEYKEQGSEEVKTLTNWFNILVSKKKEGAFSAAKGLKKGEWVYLKGNDSTRSVDTLQGYKENVATIYAFEISVKNEKQQENTPAPADI